jgi:hypothetical protein
MKAVILTGGMSSWLAEGACSHLYLLRTAISSSSLPVSRTTCWSSSVMSPWSSRSAMVFCSNSTLWALPVAEAGRTQWHGISLAVVTASSRQATGIDITTESKEVRPVGASWHPCWAASWRYPSRKVQALCRL